MGRRKGTKVSCSRNVEENGIGLMCEAHLVGVYDGTQKAFALTPQCGTQALRATDQQTDDQVRVLLDALTCE